ncbi:MAG: hypothetical protein GTO55_11350 [Armatimonadetes bacterium]|nr:hypothetical protein [Armatimonadota bacterium]NIM24812.1 hypothetical protein [Armatimonadota bacterium]NIM68703.1 hypothetical protein [Armatimonadota bacterium]NIM76998.1 hypothetical protein [Armatimonadota bacterium]NIN06903.1 hypothetical protein [Armatimonadota bacterium]
MFSDEKQAQIEQVARAIEFLGPVVTAELLAVKASDDQWGAIVSWVEAGRKETKNARLQAQITQLQSEIEE